MADDAKPAKAQGSAPKARRSGSPKAAAGGRQAKQPKTPTPEDRYKLQIADQLGLGEKVRRVGWGGLSAAETGRIGGYMTRRARAGGGDDKNRPGTGPGPTSPD